MAIKCKLNAEYKKALAKGRKLVTKTTTRYPLVWNPGQFHEQVNWNYKGTSLWRHGYHRFSRINCCGIDEGKFIDLMQIYKDKSVWHKDFDAITAFWMTQNRTKVDSRIFIAGLPVKVTRSSLYNAKFYKRLRKTLLKWGCQELVKKPYKNKNSNNYLSVLVGQF